MVRIPTYEAKQPYEVPPRPNIKVDTSVGQALQSLGSDISSAAESFDRHQKAADAQLRQKQAFGAEQGYSLLGEKADQAIIENSRGAPPDGTGITTNTLQQYDNLSADFQKGLTPELQQEFAPRLTLQRERVANKATNSEWDLGNKYSVDSLNEFGKAGEARIATNPQEYDATIEEGHALIDKAPHLTSAQRAGAHKSWNTLSKIGLGDGLIRNDPEVAKFAFGSTDVQGRYSLVARRIMKGGLIRQESGGNPNAVSPKNAIGLAQIWYPTSIEIAKEMGDTHFLNMSKEGREAYLKSPEVSLKYGEYYLTKMLTTFNGDIAKSLAAYNAGPGSSTKGTGVMGAVRKAQAAGKPDQWLNYTPAETQNYVKSIMGMLGNEKYLNSSTQLKPILANADGSVSTERTITVESDGKYAVIPTIVDGKRMSDADATELYKAGTNPPVGEYGTQAEADTAASNRSASFGTDADIAQGKEPFFSPVFGDVAPVTMKQWQTSASAASRKAAETETAETKLVESKLKTLMADDPKTMENNGVGLVTDADVPRLERAVAASLGKDGLVELDKWRRARTLAHATYTVTHDLNEISNDTIDDRLRSLHEAATPDERAILDAYVLKADKVRELREKDPGAAAMEVPAIRQLYDKMDTSNSDEVINYLGAVEKVQIDHGYISPVSPRLIPNRQAKWMGQKMRAMLAAPGADPAKVTTDVLNYFRDGGHYGQYADEVFTQVYAEALDRNITADTRLVVASTMKEWMDSQPTPSRPGHAAQNSARIAAELAASEKSMGDEGKAESRTWWQAIKAFPSDTYNMIFGNGEDNPPTDVKRGAVAPADAQAPQGGGASAIPGVDKNALDWFTTKYPDVNVLSDFEHRYGSAALTAATKLAREQKKAKNQ